MFLYLEEPHVASFEEKRLKAHNTRRHHFKAQSISSICYYYTALRKELF
jgi:hypothetical protein